MNKLHKIEKTIGGLKFAVVIIIVFSTFMIVGTFMESYFGTDFANRLIYKRWPFMLLQLCMFLSIYFAMVLRFPPKKRLYGFYTIHSGLILIGCGAFITYYAGIDGSITLSPNEPNREIILNEDIVKISFPEEGLLVTKDMPYKAFSSNIDENYRDIKLKRYLPYAENTLKWKKFDDSRGVAHSSQYMIANSNVNQEFTLSINPNAVDFNSSLTMGPLNVNYLASSMAKCFNLPGESKLIIWDQALLDCYTPEEKGISIQKTSSGNRFLVLKQDGQLFSFFPDVSPWPMDQNLKVIQDSPLRIFSKGLFEDKPHLFLFGDKLAFYLKDEQKWELHDTPTGKPVDLPWMGFQVTLIRTETNQYPYFEPQYVTPIQSNGALTKGDMKALEVEVRGETYWITDTKPLALMVDGKRVDIQLTKQTVTLPFEFVLKQFKMDKDPGTMNPASYESFVTLFTNNGPADHHIYMNNPLKYEGFTFYQASYGQSPQGFYVSTLSANVDQGRGIKYFGSILLVLGSILHYLLNKSRYVKQLNRKEQESIDLENTIQEPHGKMV